MSITSISSAAASALTQPPPQSTSGLAGVIQEVKPRHERQGGQDPVPSTSRAPAATPPAGLNKLV